MNKSLDVCDCPDSIAIISMAGRFPGAKSIDSFWENIQSGIETISFFSETELKHSGVDTPTLKNSNYVKAGAVIEDIELFDAQFFELSPKECEIIDPQHRLFLECSWEALESAGYDPWAYNGQLGVYAGTGYNTYLLNNIISNQDFIQSVDNFQIQILNSSSFLSTNISYKLNLKGPSVTVQTACSTSLVTIHLACQSLLSGECDMALAGGVSIRVPQKAGYIYQEGGVLSPDGHCRAFDAKARGTVGGNGVGIVVLKRLEDAIADGDFIHAVIKGSAINNDGHSKVSYTAPSIDGQVEVITEAFTIAEIEPDTITYVETHGTGTALGDPIEIASLTKAFRTRTDKKGFCAIGSVKTNIGHLDTAAGVAGLIKTVLALKHKVIPPSLNFEQPNPQIDFANSPFYVNTCLKEWKVNKVPRRAGISSFGIGGTNAHIILEEAPVIKASGPSRSWQLLLVSAKTLTALEIATENLTQYLQQHPDVNLADVAYTLQVGRKAFEHRRMLVCQNVSDGVQTLAQRQPQRVLSHSQQLHHRPIAFMFPGQGAQYVNMTWELYQTEAAFRQQVNDCCQYLESHLGLDLRLIIYPEEQQAQQTAQQLQQTCLAQPSLFVIEYALAQLWISWGIIPQAMIGHSIGEYVAACLAGVFSLEDALLLVAMRGRLMQQLPTGAMLSVPLSKEQVQPFLGQELWLAAENGPALCVISGTTKAIDRLQKQLSDTGINCRRLHTSHAFHSQMMEPIIQPFAQQFAKVKLGVPKVPFISNVTGSWITTAQATSPNYWAQHLRQPVCFTQGITQLLQQSKQILLEVGPGKTLSTLTRQHHLTEQLVISSLSHPQEQHSDVEMLLKALGQLWLLGVPVNWAGFYAQQQRHRLPLPTYPFERQRYWVEAQPPTNQTCSPQTSLSKKPDIADWFYIPSWKRAVPPQTSVESLPQDTYWLVFVDSCGLGNQIVNALQQQNYNVITLSTAQYYGKLNDNAYTINPQQPQDYQTFIQELQLLNKLPKVVVHLWSVTPEKCSGSQANAFEYSQDLGFYSLLFLTQALSKYCISEPVKIWVVSNNLHTVTGQETICPEKVTALSLCKVIPQEYPYISCHSIDIVLPQSGTTADKKLLAQLFTELTVQTQDLLIAYRGDYRWVQTYEKLQLETTKNWTKRLKSQGAYLITGGLGNIGLEIAEYLARAVKAKLILTGRSVFPQRNQWKHWQKTHDEQDEVSRKIQKLQAIEELNAEVVVMTADIANFEQMQAVMAVVKQRFHHLDGVIHAAGITGTNSSYPIQELSPIKSEIHFQPKIHGLYVLQKILQGQQLDFCVLFSSLSSVLGGLGFGAYSAANLFMDAFVYQQNLPGIQNWISINWDGWEFKEKQQGSFGTTMSELTLTPKEGLEVFQRVLSADSLTQVVVSTGELQTRFEQWIQLKSLQQIPSSIHSIQTSSLLYPRPNLSTAYVAPRNELEQTLVSLWQELLGIDYIGIHDNFFDLGGHSLSGIQFITRVRDTFQVDFPLRLLFESPTITSLSEEIEKIKNSSTEFQEIPIVRISREAHRIELSSLAEDINSLQS
ncbi:polyketide synthase [Nostocales cyanobacterium HT-58-2]|nr:polyketide synthase [Nostocales cyanobacterium HT-58-2]